MNFHWFPLSSLTVIYCRFLSVCFLAVLFLFSCENKTPLVENPKIIVIGAGAAGLSSARRLADEGFEVTILEARDRVGGRTWTSQMDSGVTIDLGGSWIHGSHPEFEKLVSELKLETTNSQFTNMLIFSSAGKSTWMNSEITGSLEEALFFPMLSSIMFNGKLSMHDFMEAVWNDGKLSQFDYEFVQFVKTVFFETEFAANSETIPVKAMLEWIPPISLWPEYLNGFASGIAEKNTAFPKGYNQITDHLAQGLDIKLNHIVSAIDYSQPKIKIETSQGNFKADIVIVTVPIGVLKSGNIRFTPELPEYKQNVIERMGMGVLNKLYLQFPQTFWNSDADVLGISNEQKGGFAVWINMQKITGQPILMAFSSGEFAKEMEQLSDQEIITKAMTRLKTAYGNEIPEPVSFKRTRWHSDPFAFGSYSHFALETELGDRKLLAEPIENRILFAGEATADFGFAQVPGAYMTGIREAKRIIDWYK